MDLSKVAQVVALIEAGRWSLASRGRGEQESALRRELAAMESALGVRLVAEREGDAIHSSAAGQEFLRRAKRLLHEAEALQAPYGISGAGREMRLLCSHYLATYLLVPSLGAFRERHPGVRIRLSLRNEAQILAALQQDPQVAAGFCAPLEYPEGLSYRHWFAMGWSLVLPLQHPWAGRATVSLRELKGEALIVFEAGSSGRQHLLDALHRLGVQVDVVAQATTTSMVLQMVEAGWGLAVLPLLPSGRVTRDRALAVAAIEERIDPIDSGIFVRREAEQDPLLLELIETVLATPP